MKSLESNVRPISPIAITKSAKQEVLEPTDELSMSSQPGDRIAFNFEDPTSIRIDISADDTRRKPS